MSSSNSLSPLVNVSFDHQPRTRLIFGGGVADRAGALARELGGTRCLLVTDPGIVAAGHAGIVESSLRASGLEVGVFAKVRENPTTRDVDNCLASALDCGCDIIVGLGGGSSMDTAKGCNFLLTNGGRMMDYCGIGKAKKPMLPLIAIPTTAGTGSECQSFALIAEAASHLKMACGDPKAAARVALLDPLLTLSQPPSVTAHTGIDAMTHAIETAVTRVRTPLSVMYSHQAFKLIAPGLPRVLRDPKDLEARGWMLLGAAFAGIAIENSMLGAAHAAANPLTAHFGGAHGEAVGVMLPHVIRFNAKDAPTRYAYAELASTLEIASVAAGVDAAVEALVEQIEKLLDLAGIARTPAALGLTEAMTPQLAAEAAKQWTGGFNPRPVSALDFEQLYLAALTPRKNHGP